MFRSVATIAIVFLATAAPAAVISRAAAGGQVLSNGKLELAVSTDGTLSVTSLRDGQRTTILSGARSAVSIRVDRSSVDLLAGTPVIHIIDADARLGEGKAIEIAWTSTNPAAKVRAIHSLYDGGEFFTIEIKIDARQNLAIGQSIDVLAGRIDLGGGEVRVVRNEKRWSSSVGVLESREGRSDFCSTLYNRSTQRGVVLGALSAYAGSVVRTSFDGGKASFRIQADYSGPGSGELRIAAGKSDTTGALAVCLPANIFEGMEAYGAAVKTHNNIKLFEPIPAGWCSWDAFNWIMQEKQIYDTIQKISDSRLVEYGFNTLQIDDGWQCGWRSSGDWRYNPNRFPHGIKPIAEAANKIGVTLGLWIGPFSDEDRDASAGPSGKVKTGSAGWMKHAQPVLLNFPELQTKDNKGQPTGNYDISMPAFRQHLTDIHKRLTAEYGARYIKVDFIAGGGVEADKSLPYHDIYRKAIQAMRDGMVPGTYFMTCIAPDWKGIGIADSQRIGNDVSSSWKGIDVTIRVAAARYFTNGNLWWNDPDQLHVGGSVDEKGKVRGLTMDQARAWAAMIALYGAVTLTGDDITELSPERMKLLTQCLPSTGKTARPLDLFDVLTDRSPEKHSGLWALQIDKNFGSYHVVGLFNWTTGGPQTRTMDLSDLGYGTADDLIIYDYFAGELLSGNPVQGQLSVTVPPSSVKLLVIHRNDHQVRFVSSDRHLTAGLIDLLEIDRDANSLTGRSGKLVKDVEFSYQFYLPPNRRITAAIFDGKPATIQTAGNIATVTFTPSKPEIQWSVRFE